MNPLGLLAESEGREGAVCGSPRLQFRLQDRSDQGGQTPPHGLGLESINPEHNQGGRRDV